MGAGWQQCITTRRPLCVVSVSSYGVLKQIGRKGHCISENTRPRRRGYFDRVKYHIPIDKMLSYVILGGSHYLAENVERL